MLNETSITCIGLVGAVLTTFSYFPQVVKSWKTKQTADLSLGMYVMVTSGMALWFIYGLLKMDLPLILSNALSLIFAGIILFCKLRNDREPA